MKNITTGKQKRSSVCGNCSIFLYNLIKNEVKKLNEAQIAETLGVPTCVLFAHKPCPEYLECLGSITEKIVRH